MLCLQHIDFSKRCDTVILCKRCFLSSRSMYQHKRSLTF